MKLLNTKNKDFDKILDKLLDARRKKLKLKSSMQKPFKIQKKKITKSCQN